MSETTIEETCREVFVWDIRAVCTSWCTGRRAGCAERFFVCRAAVVVGRISVRRTPFYWLFVCRQGCCDRALYRSM